MSGRFVDIHCHLTPNIDDGAKSDSDALTMARMAVAEGTEAVVATPHQLGNFRHNSGDDIRHRVQSLQELLNKNKIPLVVLPGADVRIESEMPALLTSGEVLTLADKRKHVLLELPHELYFPLEPVLRELQKLGMSGILSHPERNRGILRQPELIAPLVDAGCLMQVTTGSLLGSFGPDSQQLAERMVSRGWVHFLATDAHGPKSRRPLFRSAHLRAGELAGEQAADIMCCHNPRLVTEGRAVAPGPLQVTHTNKRATKRRGWFGKRAS